jgi:hypothetical protein
MKPFPQPWAPIKFSELVLILLKKYLTISLAADLWIIIDRGV